MRRLISKALVLLLGLSAAAYAKPTVREFTYDDHNKRDPFVPLVTKDGKILPGAKTDSEMENEQILLEGIIWDPQGNSVAIMNGKLVKEQERVFDFQILKIKKDGVILQKGGKVRVFNLNRGGGEKNE
ncbi:MAG: hypothetical protein PHO30_07335 [Candidatus Omnitrophica bacterium]|jgi:hypothetical protein|nr:hypothetical protein [Candidatus Omnitrophota bacterium]